jgi:hypothetical protein
MNVSRGMAKVAVALTMVFCVTMLGKNCFTLPQVSRASRQARGGHVVRRATQQDAIALAASELTEASYPFMQQVDWSSDLYWTVPGADPIRWARAIAKIIDMGASMDAELVKAGCLAHHGGIQSLSILRTGVCSKNKLTAIYDSIGRMIASVPVSKTMGVYNSVSELVDDTIPAYLMSTGRIKPEDATTAYAALLKFTDVVKANPITPSDPATILSTEKISSIDAAADTLASQAYPFMQDVDWTDGLYGKTVPGSLQAVDSMILMGSKMDSAAVREAAMAHVKAIENMDASGVLTKDDFKAILAGLGKSIASTDRKTAMDVYNSVGRLITQRGIPGYLLSMKVPSPDKAATAYNGLMNFKDTVRGCQSEKAISDAAAELARASYPFMQQVDWNSDLYWTVPGASPILWAQAIAKIIGMGASMDAELVKAGCLAHHEAIGEVKYKSSAGVCSESRLTAIYASIGQMIASVPESQTMDVYNSVSELVDEKIPVYLMSTGSIQEADAKAAYNALLKFTQVVKANPITATACPTAVSNAGAISISTAAGKLASAAYPFIKGVDWTAEMYGGTVPGKSAKQTLEVVDTMIMMGSKMDAAALREAAMAHVKAIQNMDAKGVLTEDDFKAILSGLGKSIASVRGEVVMSVYNEVSSLVANTGIPQYLLSMQNPTDAMTAYSALMEFKEEVRKEQPGFTRDTLDPNTQGAFALLLVVAGLALSTLGKL